MTGSKDWLGRSWPDDKLDSLLADPEVQGVVQAARSVAHSPRRGFVRRTFEAWAQQQGRSKPGAALLFLLCVRSVQWEALGGRR